MSNEAGNLAIYLRRSLKGDTLAPIEMRACLNKYGSVGSVMKRMKKALADDKRLRKRIKGLKQPLQKAWNEI
jgi:hypothetical protein